jgi:serine protease
LDGLLAQLGPDPSVAAVQVDKRLYPALVPDDTSYADQWHLFQDTAGIRMPGAWDLSTGSSAVVIAVLDTGILAHADLDAARILPGYDFISDIPTANDGNGRDNDPTDPGDAIVANECPDGGPLDDEPSSWHGLSVTGVIAATSNNNSDIAGIDFAARILPVRVLGKCGGFVSDIIEAIRWSAGLSVAGVLDNNPTPAQVINLSLAGEGACSPQEQAAIDAAVAAGAVVIVAAGNEGQDVANFSPANCDNVVTVGAVARDGSIASYANRGEEVDLVAPGGDGPDPDGKDDILTLWNDGLTVPARYRLAFIQGTSFTTAQVSAVAALMLAVDGTLTPDTVRNILRGTARSFPDSSCNTSKCGRGLLDASAALAGAADPSSVVSSGSALNTSSNGGGGGGCVMLKGATRLDPLLIWLVAVAMIGLRRRSR